MPIAQQIVILNKTSQTIQTESFFVLKMVEVNLHPSCLKPGYFAGQCCTKMCSTYVSRSCHAHKFSHSSWLRSRACISYWTESRTCLCIEGWWLQYWILRPCLSNNFLQRQAKIFASENWKKLKEAQRDAFKTKAMTKWRKGLILDQEHFVHWIPVVLLPVYVPVYLVFYCTSIVNYNPLGRVQSGK